MNTARQVADFLLWFSATHGDLLTNLKLQKLVYYAQAWYLALKNDLLFKEPIEAWVHGPVVPSLYVDFRGFGWKPITPPNEQPDLPPEVQKHLVDVYSVYGKYSAWDLERMTHQERPWLNARRGLEMDQESHNQISPEDMRDFYKSIAA